jgi:hypothetical protein
MPAGDAAEGGTADWKPAILGGYRRALETPALPGGDGLLPRVMWVVTKVGWGSDHQPLKSRPFGGRRLPFAVDYLPAAAAAIPLSDSARSATASAETGTDIQR